MEERKVASKEGEKECSICGLRTDAIRDMPLSKLDVNIT